MMDTVGLLIFGTLAASICGTQGTSSVRCQENVVGEVGTNVVVQCDINGDVELLYWFRGTNTEGTLPILSLENGGYGGSEYQRGLYGLSENGRWMTISNAQIQQEGTYTIQVYFVGGANVEFSSKISVYIRPHLDCPVIDSCDPVCEECRVSKESAGALSCHINGARPKLNITWEIISQDSVNFVKIQPVYTKWGETWNSSVRLTYHPAACDAKAVLRCVAQNPPYPFKSSDVVIQSDPCPSNSKQQEVTTQKPKEKTKNGTGTLVVILIVLLIIGGVVLFGLLAVFRRTNYQTVICPTPSDNNKNILVQKLVNSYMGETCREPDQVSGRATYKNCKCTYVDKGGSTRVRTVTDLYSSRFLKQNDRVLIVAEEGFGKSTTTKKILHNWSHSNHKYLLLYIPMGKLQPGKNVFELVLELYAQDTKLTEDDVSELVKRYDCFFLLGDLEKNRYGHCSFSETEGMLDLSIRDLLEGNVNDAYKPVTVWVTSRDDDNVNSVFLPPYTKASIKGELAIPD